jgi:AbrB family looped-hinge helix DNA binding protein
MRLTSKGQVTIPIEIRERLGLHPGSLVQCSVDGDAVRITRAPEGEGRGRTLVARLRGSAGPGPSTDEIMALTRG